MGNKLEICYKNTQTYVGQLSDSLFHGTGTIYYGDSGDYYQGKFSRGQKSGFGEYHYYSGDKYLGNFLQDQMHGKGKFFVANGYIYIGNFVAGNLMGYSKMYDPNGVLLYSGDFVNGLPHGFGISFLNNQINYVGMWALNYYSGIGVLFEGNNKSCGLFYEGTLTQELSEIPDFIQKAIKKNKSHVKPIYKNIAFYDKKNANLRNNLSNLLNKTNKSVKTTKNFTYFTNLHSVNLINPSRLQKIQTESKITINPFNKVLTNQLTTKSNQSVTSEKNLEPKNIFSQIKTR